MEALDRHAAAPLEVVPPVERGEELLRAGVRAAAGEGEVELAADDVDEAVDGHAARARRVALGEELARRARRRGQTRGATGAWTVGAERPFSFDSHHESHTHTHTASAA